MKLGMVGIGIAMVLGSVLVPVFPDETAEAKFSPRSTQWGEGLGVRGAEPVVDCSTCPRPTTEYLVALNGLNAPHPQPLSPLRGARGENESWQELFNGRDLTGWHLLGGGKARVENGLLILEHDAERRSGYLVADFPPVQNFEAVIVCRVPTGDSGFFFRSKQHPRHAAEFMGPQVQLNMQPGRGLGGIFELHGRCWVSKPEAALNARLLSGPEWTTCTLTAQGPHLQATINGVRTVDITDAGADNHFQEAGRFALQIHGGGWCRAEFRRVAVRRLD